MQKLCLSLILLLALASCARQGAPAGGPKDTRPPQVDSLHSTPNFTTRFDQRTIELKFDEWVVLSDVTTQIVISPPLAKRPEVLLKGRKVVLTFDKNEVLRPNTTYTINYGTSVKDLHEGNPAKDLRFVFSTGEFIDSLGFSGQVVDAFTGEPVDNISVLLHENLADTAVRKERPYYFTRTDKSGQYRFQNLRSGVFQVVAIEDTDQNLKWDGEIEKIAFQEPSILISDSLKGLVALKLFKNQPKYRMQSQQTGRYGQAKLVFNGPIDKLNLQWQTPPGAKVLLESAKDSLYLWYDLPTDTSWNMLVSHPEWVRLDSASGQNLPYTDTIRVKKIARADFMEKHQLGFSDVTAVGSAPTGRGRSQGAPAPVAKPAQQPTKTMNQISGQPAILSFNYPLQTIDTSLWQLWLDTVQVKKFVVRADTLHPGKCELVTDWKQGKTYMLTLLPGAITDFWGKPLADTLRRNFAITEEKQLGALTVNLEKLQPGMSYVFELMNNNNPETRRAFTADADTHQLMFTLLPVATYTGRLLEDQNNNGRWDTGNFYLKRQPERIFSKKLDPLRANWSLDVQFSAETTVAQKRNQ
ncbi:MAG: Ig-like domain-containing protein [Saprospiraceae bacterium]|nr:Ig-like domain-containing protein [Saprospiraceae bacterium]